jgi:hypothetical protein
MIFGDFRVFVENGFCGLLENGKLRNLGLFVKYQVLREFDTDNDLTTLITYRLYRRISSIFVPEVSDKEYGQESTGY